MNFLLKKRNDLNTVVTCLLGNMLHNPCNISKLVACMSGSTMVIGPDKLWILKNKIYKEGIEIPKGI